MAIIKKNELKQFSNESIIERMKELNKELMKYNSQRGTGRAIENPGRIKEIKRSIAKLLTIKKTREVQSKK